MTTTPTNIVEAAKTVILGQFNGAFARFQVAAFGDLQRAGLNPAVAHKVAFDYGSDIGNALKTADGKSKFATTVAKAKENKSSLKISANAKGVNNSRTMSLVRAAQQMSDLFDENLFASRQLPTLSKELAEYVKECQQWADEQKMEWNGKPYPAEQD